MEKGWISVSRNVADNWVHDDKPYNYFAAWIDILLLANHKDNKFPFGNEVIEVRRGSFITSELKLMERWGWSKSKLRRFLILLENDGMIIKKTDQKKTAINVVNYGVYQDSRTNKRPSADRQQTVSRPLADTNNNDNNVNNVTIKESGRFTPPSLDEISEYCTQRKNLVDPEQFINFYQSKGWMVGKNKMKDWKAAVRQWESRNRNVKSVGNSSTKQTNNKFNNFQQRTYSSEQFKEMEKLLLNKDGE